ncbi:MAG: chromate transporter [Spirochaetaceae bacterium]|jgi:chromate transporter|nr:chromate transporter [Spirochaetaceae bacterium]
MTYIVLAFEFFKIGLFSIGGGLATLPFIVRLAGHVSWLSPEEVPAMLAVVQILPGGIGVNLSAYSGWQLSPLGAYIAVLALVTPQIICITLIARMLDRFDSSPLVKRVFSGLSPAAAGLLAAVAFGLLKQFLVNSEAETALFTIKYRELLLCAAIFCIIRFFPRAPLVLIIGGAALAGIVLGL